VVSLIALALLLEEMAHRLTITNYGYPIAVLAARQDTSVPAVYVGAQ
jgi:hypothetical protein